MEGKQGCRIGIWCRRPPPAGLRAVAESFRSDGYSCAFLNALADDLDLIIAAVPPASGLPPPRPRPPVLFYVAERQPVDLERLELSAYDDFLIAPAPLSEI